MYLTLKFSLHNFSSLNLILILFMLFQIVSHLVSYDLTSYLFSIDYTCGDDVRPSLDDSGTVHHILADQGCLLDPFPSVCTRAHFSPGEQCCLGSLVPPHGASTNQEGFLRHVSEPRWSGQFSLCHHCWQTCMFYSLFFIEIIRSDNPKHLQCQR